MARTHAYTYTPLHRHAYKGCYLGKKTITNYQPLITNLITTQKLLAENHTIHWLNVATNMLISISRLFNRFLFTSSKYQHSLAYSEQLHKHSHHVICRSFKRTLIVAQLIDNAIQFTPLVYILELDPSVHTHTHTRARIHVRNKDQKLAGYFKGAFYKFIDYHTAVPLKI